MTKLWGLTATMRSLFGGHRPTFGFVVLPFVGVVLFCHLLGLCCSLVPLFFGVVLLPSPAI